MNTLAAFAQIEATWRRDHAPVRTTSTNRLSIFKAEKGDTMPIQGLTDRTSLKPQLPRLGKLHKGAEKDGNKIGKDLRYFRFTSDTPGALTAFHNAYGAKPDTLRIVLFYETYEETFSSWIEAYDASGMKFRSDGDNWVVWREGDEMKTGTRPHQDDPDQSEIGRLALVLPKLWDAGYRGTVTLETHSNHDLRHIGGILLAAEKSRGSLRGAEFTMSRVETEISVPGFGDRKGKRSKAKKWLVKLSVPADIFQIGAPAPAPTLADTVTGEIVGDNHKGDWPDETFQAGEEEPEPEPARDTSPIAGPAWHKAWSKIWNKAHTLKIIGPLVADIVGEITEDAIKERGLALKDKIAQVEADLQAKQSEMGL